MSAEFPPPDTQSPDDESEYPVVTLSEMSGVRFLHLASPWVQGAMRISKPLRIELDYVRRMMVWMLLRPEADVSGSSSWRGLRTVQLGLGAGAITRYCHQVLGAHTTVVELNPGVIAAGHVWFHLPRESDTLRILQQDAGAFVEDPAQYESVDALCVDLYDHEAAGPVLDSESFYKGCWNMLRPGGIMTVNLFGRHSSFERSFERIATAFGAEAMFNMKPTREGNTVVGGVKQLTWPQAPVLAARAENIDANFDLPALQWLKWIVR